MTGCFGAGNDYFQSVWPADTVQFYWVGCSGKEMEGEGEIRSVRVRRRVRQALL